MAGRVLVVDDESHILQVLSFKLRKAGLEVSTAVDGEEGLEAALQERPDLIITDFQMPYMTGLELCRALAEREETRDIPVLMLTARGYSLDAEDLQLCNLRDVLSKPFSPRTVLEQVMSILGGEAGSKRESA